MSRFAAAWVIVWGLFIASASAQSGPSRDGAGSDYALTPILSMQSEPVMVAPTPQQAPVQAPLPQAFWQGLACMAMLLVSWRVCKTVALR